MTSEELGQLFPVIIQNYSEKWPIYYKIEKKLLLDSFLQSEILNIDHIGSTAIPGLKAKPTIDILLQVSEQIDVHKLKNILKSLGYQFNKRADKPPPHMAFVKGYTNEGIKGQSYHVHIRYKGDWDEIRFRDYLISHKEIAKEYEALKLKFADRYKYDREAYTHSKIDYIEKINKLTENKVRTHIKP
ncbi:MAG: GrpB family protein [Bacteroidetes bacterium]|nr:GrpB family protein [Bacteroidota bacterium]